MVPRLGLVALAVGGVLAALFAWVGGAAAAVFSFLGSGFLLGVLYGQAGSSVGSLAEVDADSGGVADVTEQDAGATNQGRGNSGLQLGLGLFLYVLGGFCVASVGALAVLIVA
jgi:hypothetical protein